MIEIKGAVEEFKSKRWVALVGLHFCIFSIGLYGSGLFWLANSAADYLVLVWGVVASLFGTVICRHWAEALR